MEKQTYRIQTSKVVSNITFHLHQIVKHRVQNKDAPTKIYSENLISDKIFLENIHWIITSLSDGITLQRPGFGKETVTYNEEYVKNNIEKFNPLTEDSVPVYGY